MPTLNNAATNKNTAYYAWLQFLAAPLGTLHNVSLVLRESGTLNFSGPCIVAGELHASAVSNSLSPQNVFEQRYVGTTNVASLNVSPGGNGMVHWFPYVDRGVGECNIPFHAPVGTVAITAGMNGCSLRLYVDTRLGIVKFCHDNNGNYADDAAYLAKGFDHLLSINAGTRTRGLPAQNINNYWRTAYDSPGTGVYFISVKTGPSQWKVYKSIVIGSFGTEIVRKVFSSNQTKFIQTYSGNQGDNDIAATIDIPALVPTPAPNAAPGGAQARARARSI